MPNSNDFVGKDDIRAFQLVIIGTAAVMMLLVTFLTVMKKYPAKATWERKSLFWSPVEDMVHQGGGRQVVTWHCVCVGGWRYCSTRFLLFVWFTVPVHVIVWSPFKMVWSSFLSQTFLEILVHILRGVFGWRFQSSWLKCSHYKLTPCCLDNQTHHFKSRSSAPGTQSSCSFHNAQ